MTCTTTEPHDWPAPALDWFDVARLTALPLPPFGRCLDRAFVRRLAQQWSRADDHGVVHVSEHSDGTLVLVDGRHRVAAAVLVERMRLPAAVYESLTPGQEVALFTALNRRAADGQRAD